ncbi:VOC family protein [Telmatospirillum siberiense]|uniref:VOC family protein n=1 Tax=Telmatospirillum siberiense TaxID=382514 RepID=A0A2N3PV77_9PROT|nr:VOC family protein [Telmatospirillum siberiense]PKU24299.1 VOC family protein [Telmatospirillum siberiense]
MPTESPLDHLVINCRFETDAAQRLFAGLGFTLTPRGHHSLGSINHLAVFQRNYLELIGLPADGGKLRQEILDSPQGIDGLVFASRDALASHAALSEAGFGLQPVQHFSRPVEADGAERLARFSTVRLLPGQIAAGRVYVCQHHTPELVWRPEWIRHPNGTRDIAGLVIVTETLEKTQADLARLRPLSGGFPLDLLKPDDFAGRYGTLADHAPRRADFFGAIRFHCDDLAGLAGRAADLGLPLIRRESGVSVALPQFQALLEFVP